MQSMHDLPQPTHYATVQSSERLRCSSTKEKRLARHLATRVTTSCPPFGRAQKFSSVHILLLLTLIIYEMWLPADEKVVHESVSDRG